MGIQRAGAAELFHQQSIHPAQLICSCRVFGLCDNIVNLQWIVFEVEELLIHRLFAINRRIDHLAVVRIFRPVEIAHILPFVSSDPFHARIILDGHHVF